MVGRHDSRQAQWLQGKLTAYILNHSREAEGKLGIACSFETPKPTPSDILPLARPYFLMLPRQYHQLKIKYWSIWASRGHSHSNNHWLWSWVLERWLWIHRRFVPCFFEASFCYQLEGWVSHGWSFPGLECKFWLTQAYFKKIQKQAVSIKSDIGVKVTLSLLRAENNRLFKWDRLWRNVFGRI